MNYDEINDVKEIESVLHNFGARLDECDYDDEEEYELETKEISVDDVMLAARRASQLGSVMGFHLYGYLLSMKAMQLKSQSEPYEEVQEEAKKFVIEAAKLGCWGAMEDLATEATDKLGCTNAEQIAFYKLSGAPDLEKHIEYCNRHCDANITENEIEEGIKLYKEISLEMVSKSITKQPCCCKII